MNVLHVGTVDNVGGAAKASWRLHQGLQMKNYCMSRMLVGIKDTNSSFVDVIPRNQGFFYKRLNSLTWRLGLQYLIYPWGGEFLSHDFYKWADIIHFHNIHGGFFSHTLFPKIKKPIVWTIHDMWPMTGHCSYPQLYDCKKWLAGCGNCPALHDYPEIGMDTTAYLWKKKRDVYRKANLTVVAPSTWMYANIRKSPVLQGIPPEKIPYGIDVDFYKPMLKHVAREKLGWAQGKKIVLFVAFDVNSERKGLQYIGSGDFTVFTVGKHGMAEVKDEKELVTYYSAADVLAFPSQVDNLPLTVMESLACGTPVVAFENGGTTDLVRHGETGYVVYARSKEEFTKAIGQLLSDDEKRGLMGLRARQMMCEEFNSNVQAERFIRLYENCISNRTN